MKNITKRGKAMKWLGLGGVLLGLVAPFAAAGPEQDTELAEKAFGLGDLVVSGALWTKAANEGYAPAQVRLADVMDKAEDDVGAVEWYRKAAAQGNAGGEYGLGLMYAKGEGIKKDQAEALSHFLRAAEKSYQPAMAVMMSAYTHGDMGVAADKAQADAWKAKLAALPKEKKAPEGDQTKKVDAK